MLCFVGLKAFNIVNPLNAGLNPICHSLALIEHTILSTLAGYGLNRFRKGTKIRDNFGFKTGNTKSK